MISRQFDPINFIAIADGLLRDFSNNPTVTSQLDQAKVRASVGRSYYAAYLLAREKLLSLARFTPTGTHGDHELIVQALGGVGSELGGRLDRLRSKRNKADYNLNPRGFTLQSGQLWLETARNLAQEIANLS